MLFNKTYELLASGQTAGGLHPSSSRSQVPIWQAFPDGWAGDCCGVQRGGPQEFGKGLRLPGEGIRDVREVSHKHLNEVWKCLQTGYLDDLKSSEIRLKTSAII